MMDEDPANDGVPDDGKKSSQLDQAMPQCFVHLYGLRAEPLNLMFTFARVPFAGEFLTLPLSPEYAKRIGVVVDAVSVQLHQFEVIAVDLISAEQKPDHLPVHLAELWCVVISGNEHAKRTSVKAREAFRML